MGGGSASTCNLHYFLNFLLYILVISNLFLFAVQNFRCFSRHFYSFFYFVFCLRSIGGFFCCKPIFSIDQSPPPPHYSGPCIYNEHFYIYFLCCIFLLFIRTFFLFLYIIKICIYVCICTFFLYISLALLLIIIFIYSSFSSFIFCYRHSCVLRYVSFCFSTLVNRKK